MSDECPDDDLTPEERDEVIDVLGGFDPPFESTWMLCEACHYSWLRDPTRTAPTTCPECRSSRLTAVAMGTHHE